MKKLTEALEKLGVGDINELPSNVTMHIATYNKILKANFSYDSEGNLRARPKQKIIDLHETILTMAAVYIKEKKKNPDDADIPGKTDPKESPKPAEKKQEDEPKKEKSFFNYLFGG